MTLRPVRPLWQTECAGQLARLDVLPPGRVRLRWSGAELAAGELVADTVEDVLALAAADLRLPQGLYAQLLTDLDLLAGGPPRPWTPPEEPRA